MQSEKAKRAGNTPSTVTVAEFLARMKFHPDSEDLWEPLVLEEESHVNARAATLSVSAHTFLCVFLICMFWISLLKVSIDPNPDSVKIIVIV